MIGRKAPVIGGVPVLGRDDVVEIAAVDQSVDHGNDRVSVRHGQGSAGQEVVLHIDDDQRAF